MWRSFPRGFVLWRQRCSPRGLREVVNATVCATEHGPDPGSTLPVTLSGDRAELPERHQCDRLGGIPRAGSSLLDVNFAFRSHSVRIESRLGTQGSSLANRDATSPPSIVSHVFSRLLVKVPKNGTGNKSKKNASANSASSDAEGVVEEDKEGAEGGESPEGTQGPSGSIRDLHLMESGSIVKLRRSDFGALLVEGVPAGLEALFSEHLGDPDDAHSFLVRDDLACLLAYLRAHSAHLQTAPLPAHPGAAAGDPVDSGRAPRADGGDGRGPGTPPSEPSSPEAAASGDQAETGTASGPTATEAPRGQPAHPGLRIRQPRILFHGPAGSGKSVLLALAAAWARANGWVVLYVPKAREWTRGGLYFPHPGSQLWDTPLHAQHVLQNLKKAHGGVFSGIPVASREPLSLSRAPGTVQEKAHTLPPASWTLLDLVSHGITHPDAAVSVLLRLRHELALVRSVPFLVAIDEFNAWFTFSQHYESTGDRSRRQIHANKLRMVRAFRPLDNLPGPAAAEHPSNPVVAAAFSETISVGRLPPKLPGVPRGAAIRVQRFSIDESLALLSTHPAEQVGEDRMLGEEAERIVRAHFLAMGNGAELRRLAFIAKAPPSAGPGPQAKAS